MIFLIKNEIFQKKTFTKVAKMGPINVNTSFYVS
jgi:hypothetical protein